MAVRSCSLFNIETILLFPTALPVVPSIQRVTATELAADPDLALVRRAQAGDAAAFGDLVERNRRAVFRAALAAVGSPTEADDVAQEAFVTAFQKLNGFRAESSFKTWLLTITWRKAVDRRQSVTRWMQKLVSPSAADADEGRDPTQALASGALS